MKVRVTRKPPAPLMDGFNVSGLAAGVTYDLESRLAEYLLDSGYATAVPPSLQRADDRVRSDRKRPGRRDR
jgi:hypothetical protein